jgi:hypothetical protein
MEISFKLIILFFFLYTLLINVKSNSNGVIPCIAAIERLNTEKEIIAHINTNNKAWAIKEDVQK